MARTLDLYQLISQPFDLRDEEWERAFFEALLESRVSLDAEESKVGPDGWPYLFVRTDPQAKEPVLRVLNWLLPRGIGLVVNAQKVLPDYIFPYGMLWNYRETGRFLAEDPPNQSGTVTYKKEEGWIFGPPTEKYLPRYVRDVLRQFLNNQGVATPKILVASSADFKSVDLMVSVNSLGHPPAKEHESIAKAISWFLPVHYSIVLAEEAGLPPFVNL